ncbi:MAG: PBP1A family penicillin-binding protein [Myxococcota bacterium]|nr:PBP1A family penicillin-binding protein [Myxococcota bacterium]
MPRRKRGAAARGRKRATARGSRRPARGGFARFVLRSAALMLLGSGFAAGFVVGREGMRLDAEVRQRFEGRLFRVPSRVMSAPLMLYPELESDLAELRASLDRMGYRPHPGGGALPVGRYAVSGDRLLLHRRAFEHPTRGEPASQVEIRVRGGMIDRLRDSQSGRELGAFFLEPELVGAYYGPDREQRDLVELGDVPQDLVDAVLAVEDQRFLTHKGVDVRRVLGAALVNLRSGGIRQGGSTLTQQLVKNFFLTPERSYQRKAREALMALIVEARYDKSQILEAYLNEIYLGQRGSTAIHGVGEASRFFFGKRARHLTLAESALLAAIIKSPNGLSPRRHPEAATERRDLVLRLMSEQGRISQTRQQQAESEPLVLAQATSEPGDARYFLDALRGQLPAFYGSDSLTAQGLTIYSTLDLRLQMLASKVVREELARLEEQVPKLAPKQGAPLQACLLALRPQTGEVLAVVGGRDYGRSQFNRCFQARRQAGSSFKPFVLAAALEPVPGRRRFTLADRLDDSPLRLQVGRDVWQPANFDGEFHGEVSVREALQRSLNIPIARLAQSVGVDAVREVARRLGIESPLPPVPSLALGVADVTPLEMARAYAAFANGGIRPQIRTFEDVIDADGRAMERQGIAFERVLDSGTAYLVTSALEGVVDRGTARRVRSAGIRGPAAGKTGTTDEERDAWFVGFTPEMVVAVWVGFDQPRSLGIPSSQAALPLWIRFFQETQGGQTHGRFAPPGGVVALDVDPRTGARALAGCPERTREFFLQGTEPSAVCPPWAKLPEAVNPFRLLDPLQRALRELRGPL